jgi:hypothetical protein
MIFLLVGNPNIWYIDSSQLNTAYAYDASFAEAKLLGGN